MKQLPYHQYRQKRTVVLANLQPTFEKNPKSNTEMLGMATMLLAKASSPNPEVIAIVHVDDKKGQETFQRLRQPTYAVNGEYKEVLSTVISQLAREEMQELVVIGDEPDLGVLCAMVARNQGQVTIWSVDKTPQALMAPEFTNRHVSELPFSGAGGQNQTVTVWIDLENILFRLKKMGRGRITAKELVREIKRSVKDLGNVVSMTAYADFKVLAREFGPDLQYELEELGVKTRFQINHRGKNSADMAMASDIQTSLELDPTIQIVVILSGDRDLNPAIDAARQRGKKVVVIAFEQSLSNQLRRNADEVRLLDDFFGAKSDPVFHKTVLPRHPLLSPMMRLADRMYTNRWRWIYTNRLEDLMTPEEVEQLLGEGLLQSGRPGDSRSVTFNLENPLAGQIQLAGGWIPARVDYLIRKKQMPWVDTGYLVRGMELDPKCRRVGLGQNWDNATTWLDAAAAAELVEKQQMPHPENEEKILDTWWPVGRSPDVSKENPVPAEGENAAAKPEEPEEKTTALEGEKSNSPVAQSQAF